MYARILTAIGGSKYGKKRVYRCFPYFTRGELALWGTSTALILAFFLAYDRTQFGILAASLIGVTSLIFNAKGNPFGQLLMVCFSALYGVISFLLRVFMERWRPGNDCANGGIRSGLLAAESVSETGPRSRVRRLERRGCCLDADPDRGIHSSVYFILAALTNRLIPKHASVPWPPASGRLPDLSAQRPVCGRLCLLTWSWSYSEGWPRQRPLLSSGPGLLFLYSWSTISMAF